MRIEKFIPRRLWQQIFLIILTLVIVPLVILGALLIQTSEKVIKETVSRDLKQIALHATGEVIKEYEGAYHALDATASILGTLHAEIWRQETAVVQLSLKYPALRHICSVDLKGHPLACSDLDKPLTKQIQFDSNCIRNQDHCVSKVRIAADYVPVMDIMVPIRHYGKTEGVLMAEYSLRGVWEVVDKIQFGPQSRAIVVDQYGRILAHPDKKEVLKNNMFNDPEVIADLDQGKNDTRLIVDGDHQRWIIAYSPIPSLHWGLIVAQPYSEAFAFVRLMHFHSWLLIIFSIFAAGLIGLIVAQWMSRPMQEMIEATHRVAKGDLNVSMIIHRRDEIGRLKFAFNNMIMKLKKAREVERLSIVGKSAANIAHELKNSLVLVKTFVQLIPERHKDKAFVQDASKTITRELDSWNEMLRNMRDFAYEQMPHRFEAVDINVLLEDATLLTKLKGESQKLRFSIQTTSSTSLIQADEGKIKQVLINLIANAFEATQPGGEILVRTVSEYSLNREWVGFEVIDSGEGITPEDIEKIFHPFFTTKDMGLGLGLAICRDIVYKHSGRLEVISQKGHGATFKALFPIIETKLQKG